MGAFLFNNFYIYKMEKIDNSKGEWYLVEIIQRFEPLIRNESSDLKRAITYGNYHLIKASSPSAAYDKGEKLGKEGTYTYQSHKIEMEVVFVGIGQLLPIYEDIEDGAEILWNDFGHISQRKANRLISSKEEMLAEIKPKTW